MPTYLRSLFLPLILPFASPFPLESDFSADGGLNAGNLDASIAVGNLAFNEGILGSSIDPSNSVFNLANADLSPNSLTLASTNTPGSIVPNDAFNLYTTPDIPGQAGIPDISPGIVDGLQTSYGSLLSNVQSPAAPAQVRKPKNIPRPRSVTAPFACKDMPLPPGVDRLVQACCSVSGFCIWWEGSEKICQSVESWRCCQWITIANEGLNCRYANLLPPDFDNGLARNRKQPVQKLDPVQTVKPPSEGDSTDVEEEVPADVCPVGNKGSKSDGTCQ